MQREDVELVREQGRQRDSQRTGNPGHNKEARIPRPPFDSAQIGQINLSLERELLLSHLFLLADSPDVFAEDAAPIPHCRIEQYRAYKL